MLLSEYLRSRPNDNQQRIAVFLLFFLLFVFVFLFQGKRGLWQPDEGCYVGTAYTMAKSGDLVIPRLGDTIFLDKPPLIYWGIISGIHLFGKNEFGARAFHALCFAFTVLAVGFLGRNLFGDTRSGFFSGLIYATMIMPYIAANFVTPDSLLVLWTTLSMLFFWKSVSSKGQKAQLWKVLMSAALGFGFLTKGPAVLLPCGGMFVFLIVRRQTLKYFVSWWSLVCFLTFALIGLSWYLWVAFKVPGAWTYFFDNQVWGRLVTSKYNRNPGLSGALIYIPVLLFGTLPWTFVWWQRAGELKNKIINKQWWLDLKDRPDILFLLTWFWVPIIVLSLASSKLGLYALPVFPAVALGTVKFWRDRPSFNSTNLWAKKNFKAIVMICCLVLTLLGSKFVLSYYPTEKNAKELWLSLKDYLPQGDYEIVTIDDHYDGLLFYGAQNVENVTIKTTPYPFFIVPENIALELIDILKENENTVFLAKDSNQASMLRKLLLKSKLNITEVRLPYNRCLLVHESRKLFRKPT